MKRIQVLHDSITHAESLASKKMPHLPIANFGIGLYCWIRLQKK